MKIMKIKNIAVLFSLMIVLFACKSNGSNPDMSELRDDIESLEEKTFSDKEEFNSELANDLLEKYLQYSNLFPKDSLAPEYLMKASSIASGLENPQKAIDCLTKIEKEYPNYDKMANVLFQHAFVLENEIKDKNAAKEYYELFIEKYPSHVLAEDAQNAIALMNLSDEELIQFLEAKNKK